MAQNRDAGMPGNVTGVGTAAEEMDAAGGGDCGGPESGFSGRTA
jgi:hypothetical protein